MPTIVGVVKVRGAKVIERFRKYLVAVIKPAPAVLPPEAASEPRYRFVGDPAVLLVKLFVSFGMHIIELKVHGAAIAALEVIWTSADG